MEFSEERRNWVSTIHFAQSFGLLSALRMSPNYPSAENGLARGVLALGDDFIVGCVGMVRHLFVVRMTWTIPDEERELGLVTLFVRLFQIRSRQ